MQITDDIVAAFCSAALNRLMHEDGCPESEQIRAGIEAVAQMIEANASALLSDPTAVHANMLRGTIAKPTWDQIQHLYREDVTKQRLAVLEFAAIAVETAGWHRTSCDGVTWETADDQVAYSADAIRKLGETYRKLEES